MYKLGQYLNIEVTARKIGPTARKIGPAVTRYDDLWDFALLPISSLLPLFGGGIFVYTLYRKSLEKYATTR